MKSFDGIILVCHVKMGKASMIIRLCPFFMWQTRESPIDRQYIILIKNHFRREYKE
jgi:hypothetical protein